jgi:hypothetical protein
MMVAKAGRIGKIVLLFWMSSLALALAGLVYLGAVLDEPEFRSWWSWRRSA